jgi:hypothetical protein
MRRYPDDLPARNRHFMPSSDTKPVGTNPRPSDPTTPGSELNYGRRPPVRIVNLVWSPSKHAQSVPLNSEPAVAKASLVY